MTNIQDLDLDGLFADENTYEDHSSLHRYRELLEDQLRASCNDYGDPWMKFGQSGPYNWVTDRIAIGGDDYLYETGLSHQMVREGVTHILDCRIEGGTKGERLFNRFKYLKNGTNDDLAPKGVEYFRRSVDFGLAALSKPEAKLYIHCAAGINRGPSSGYAVMRALGFSAEETWRLIRLHRPCSAIAYAGDAERALIQMGHAKGGLV